MEIGDLIEKEAFRQRFFCGWCGEGFYWPYQLNDHIAEKVCENCGCHVEEGEGLHYSEIHAAQVCFDCDDPSRCIFEVRR